MAFEFDFNETFKLCAQYLAKGLRVVRLHGILPDGRCTCHDPECRVGGTKQKNCGKHPVGTNWGDRYARDEDDLLSWDDGTPFNVGVLLGPSGGVIDNEDDCPEATAFRESLGLHELITPSWTSGKSTHQMTKWDDRLSACGGVVKPGGLECRLGAGDRQIQSVLPPSWHHTGVQYKWKPDLSLDDVEIAETPKALLVQIINGEGGKAGKPAGEFTGSLMLKTVHDGEGRHRSLLLFAWGEIVGDRFPTSPERRPIITQRVLDANQLHIDPPKSRDEVLKIVNSCFEHYRRKQDTGWQPSPSDITPEQIAKEAESIGEAEVAVVGLEQQGLEPYQAGSVMGYRVGSWYIEMIQGDPAEIVLCVPQWKNTPCRGRVHMTLDTFRSAPKVAATIFSATRRVIVDGDSKKWFGVWKGVDASKKTGGVSVPGLMEQLMARKTADHDIQVGTSSKRYAQLAGYVIHALKKSKRAKDEDKPEPLDTGRPCWVTPDELWLQWGGLWEEIGRAHPDVTPSERNKVRGRLLEAMGAKDFIHKRHRFPLVGRLEYVVFTPEWIAALEEMASGADVDGETVKYAEIDSDFANTENLGASTVHSS